MSLFNSQTFSVKRPSAYGQYVKGRWVAAADSPAFSITGTWHPETGERFTSQLQGRRITSIGVLITESELFQQDDKVKTPGDVVTVGGQDYLVWQKMAWQNGILPHYEYVLIREIEGAAA